jgi:hypothetical protein
MKTIEEYQAVGAEAGDRDIRAQERIWADKVKADASIAGKTKDALHLHFDRIFRAKTEAIVLAVLEDIQAIADETGETITAAAITRAIEELS